MNRKILLIVTIVLLAAGLLSGCRAVNIRLGQRGQNQGKSGVVEVATAEPTATARPLPTRKPRPTTTPTVDAAKAQSALAEQAVRDYFAGLEKQDYEHAADLLSTYSLMVFDMTRGDAAAALHKQMSDGQHWSNLAISETKPFDDHTLLVHVTYTLAVKDKSDTKDELWPVRLENDAWRCNWNNLIDFHTLEVPDQTMNGITLKPVQVNRFTDRLQLVILAQNRTNEALVFGQANEILGTFHFGDQAVVAEKTQIILNPLRSIPDVKLEIKGLFDRYPDSIEIRKWKNYNVKPWYVFQLQ